jgi:hypothetical protein
MPTVADQSISCSVFSLKSLSQLIASLDHVTDLSHVRPQAILRELLASGLRDDVCDNVSDPLTAGLGRRRSADATPSEYHPRIAAGVKGQ